ncbi:MAG TPA: TlpA disulfide reductase family protein [Vicinamibacterales bacterium]|nr:TlpA disulfide reductase family protein [Vicinamibacterales bacterium]
MALSTIRIAALAAVTLATVTAAAAVAVADDRPAIGTAAPLPAVHDLAGRARPLSEIKGRRGLVILFWARWSDRSVEELKRLDAASQDLAAHGVTVAAVNVDRVEPDAADTTTLRAQIDALQVRVPVFVDRGLELFHTYGVVTVPSTAVVDERGRLSYFLYGYSHEQREAMFDAIDTVAGIARRPVVAARTPVVAPAALRRLQLGRLQLQQGHADAARSSFELAAKADGTFPDPLVELAALALDMSDGTGARGLLDRAAALDQRNSAVRRERARLAAVDAPAAASTAEAETALADLATHDDAVAAGYLGFLLWASGDHARADRAFEQARQISGVDPRSWIAGEQPARAAVWPSMMRYRRQIAVALR